MSFLKGFSPSRAIGLGQWDKLVLTLAGACLLPFFIHTLPFFSAIEVGQRWLPIFYAPLVASLCFRPHVSVLAALCAPFINHALFGLPDHYAILTLTTELVLFTAAMAIIQRRSRVTGWHVVSVFIVARFLALLVFGPFSGSDMAGHFLGSLQGAWPGVAVLVFLTELVNRIRGRWRP